VSAVALNDISFNDFIAIVSALNMDIGPKDFQKIAGIVFPENKSTVDHAQSADDQQTVVFVLQRPSGPFKPPYYQVGIDSDRQDIAKTCGFGKIVHVSGMDDIETSVRRDKLFAGCAKRPEKIPNFPCSGKNVHGDIVGVHERKITISYRMNQAKKIFHASQSIIF